jgi:hypothetical protein
METAEWVQTATKRELVTLLQRIGTDSVRSRAAHRCVLLCLSGLSSSPL